MLQNNSIFIYFIVLYFNDHINCEETLKIHIKQKPINDYILCRGCGSEITDSYNLLNHLSPVAKASFNDTLYKKEKILIQILPNPISYNFAVITSSKASCEGIGEWQWNDSWYPGYIWRPCICPECGAHIGWVFEPMDSLSNKPFFGLILPHLIGESFTDSIITYPNIENIT